ncbi:MAG: vanadium-dependent haloperoxidase, partial [Candidatus Rokuibacteriota bacterium]
LMRPAPRIDGAENSAEMAELYWMALARDVPFASYGSDQTIGFACTDLSHFSDFRGPKSGNQVTPATIFRGTTPGDLAGPFVSQFLLRDFRYGSLTVSQRQQTVLPGVDYLTDFASWLAIQNGGAAGPDAFDPTPRYIRNLRDLGQYVHVDALYEAYLNACLILLELGAPLDPGLPPTVSATQAGFAEFGGPHVLSLVTEVATRALKAVWCQKWLVHRRLRPEEFGGRLHNFLTGAATYAINSEILASTSLARIFSAHGTFLLPQQFPDGCPTHPAYASGHASVAGACVTVLKAFFDETFVLPNPVVPNPGGTALVPYTDTALTIGGELDKVAANIATGRNAAGIHWRTDFTQGLTLGELVAIGVLEEQKACYNQDVSMTFRRFDGSTVTI